jgi:hypothetical protein
MDNRNIVGNEISSSVDTLNNCINKCNTTAGCVAFTYKKNDSLCSLKNNTNIVPVVVSDTSVVFSKQPIEPTMTFLSITYDGTTNTAFIVDSTSRIYSKDNNITNPSYWKYTSGWTYRITYPMAGKAFDSSNGVTVALAANYSGVYLYLSDKGYMGININVEPDHVCYDAVDNKIVVRNHSDKTFYVSSQLDPSNLKNITNYEKFNCLQI